MRVLVIDDADYKADKIIEILKQEDSRITDIDYAASTGDGLRQLYFNTYDLVVLDMQMPFDSSPRTPIDTDAWLDILMEMERREVTTPVIICSSDVDRIEDHVVIEDTPIVGKVRYDSFVYLNPYFKEILEKL